MTPQDMLRAIGATAPGGRDIPIRILADAEWPPEDPALAWGGLWSHSIGHILIRAAGCRSDAARRVTVLHEAAHAMIDICGHWPRAGHHIEYAAALVALSARAERAGWEGMLGRIKDRPGEYDVQDLEAEDWVLWPQVRRRAIRLAKKDIDAAEVTRRLCKDIYSRRLWRWRRARLQEWILNTWHSDAGAITAAGAWGVAVTTIIIRGLMTAH